MELDREAAEPAAGTARFGPVLTERGATFRLWAPGRQSIELRIEGRDPMVAQGSKDGLFSFEVEGAGPGTRYLFHSGGLSFPDPASRQQLADTSGWSVVAAPLPGPTQRTLVRPWHESVIAEVHVGAATPEGTFSALAGRLEHFRDAGYTCLEIMPVNAFPGQRGWGYDGTLIFAPAPAYGTPQELRALVDRAHELGLTMILDVVYNHFGETDNYIPHYAPSFFRDDIRTPWGPGINFDEPMVRQFYYENAMMWLSACDFDGLRFDSIHEIRTDSRARFLGELAAAARSVKPDAALIVENVRNNFELLERDDGNRPMQYSAQWNDDMHHVLAFLVTGEGARTGYDDPDKDPYADLEKALADGFVHDPSEGDGSDGRTRGGDGAKLPPDSFITYLQNHDQLGNRSDAKRLSLRISPEQLDFAHFVKFLAPQIPLCFMGDEANLETGFPYFVDLPEAAGRAKAAERYRQMEEMFHDDVEPGGLPDPNDPATFEMARLRWDDYQKPEHRAALERFRTLARWRREKLWPLAATPCLDARTARQGDCLIVNWVFEAGTLRMALNPTPSACLIDCVVGPAPVASGSFSQQDRQLRLEPWSAVAW
ncbi:alpha-amylase family glycosyl hydrolase [Devosia sp. A16]|uniref:alpha-amylase family glycosyl hydrolase n=1 Tax=Devosia sp. A16 TaxID=1736675 RepID=UPI0006D80E26|nr:alpha-amylase family glycosyl hydrolase [Devosia sp. A16]